MSRDNKYLRDFLNLLNDDQIFYSYLTNTFMLNQISSLVREMKDGIRSEEEVEKDLQNLMDSIELLAPTLGGLSQSNLTKEEFYMLLKTVKDQTIQNLAERRRN